MAGLPIIAMVFMRPVSGHPNPSGMRRAFPVATHRHIMAIAICPVFVYPYFAMSGMCGTHDGVPLGTDLHIYLGGCRGAK
jgi:hypothetical protein